jgi:uncharacterized membrane protein
MAVWFSVQHLPQRKRSRYQLLDDILHEFLILVFAEEIKVCVGINYYFVRSPDRVLGNSLLRQSMGIFLAATTDGNKRNIVDGIGLMCLAIIS